MAVEVWALAAAVLFAAAAAGGAVAQAGRGRPWLLATVALRAAAGLALSVAVTLAAAGRSGWSPLDAQQMALSLALSVSTAHLVLGWTLRAAAGVPVADFLAGALAVAAWLALRPAGDSLSCLQRALPYRAEWVLLLAGAGGILVAGSAALPVSRLRAGPEAWPVVNGGSRLGVLLAGAGVLVGVWWTWQATGSFEAGDVRESWMGVVWLLAAMSLVAGQLEKGARRWAAGLALTAAAAALLGLLALPQLQRLVGI